MLSLRALIDSCAVPRVMDDKQIDFSVLKKKWRKVLGFELWLIQGTLLDLRNRPVYQLQILRKQYAISSELP